MVQQASGDFNSVHWLSTVFNRVQQSSTGCKRVQQVSNGIEPVSTWFKMNHRVSIDVDKLKNVLDRGQHGLAGCNRFQHS